MVNYDTGYTRSDISIHFDNMLFNVHRNILASHSTYFQEMFNIYNKDKQQLPTIYHLNMSHCHAHQLE